jgi:hypothetical protein
MPSSDPDEAAMRLIEKHAMFRLRDVIGKDEYCCRRDVIQRFPTSPDEKIEIQAAVGCEPGRTVKLEGSKFYAWDILDIVKAKLPFRCKQLNVSEDWTTLAKNILVLFDQGYGHIIRPAQGSRICSKWNTTPSNLLSHRNCEVFATIVHQAR